MRWTFHSGCPDQRDFHFDTRFALSQRLVRAVTERRGFGLLAHAQGNFFRFIYCKLDWLDPGSLVGPVTERLIPRSPTLTPIVRSHFQRKHFGLLGCDAWFLHERSSLCGGWDRTARLQYIVSS
jgi:hypothetical protein